MAKNKPYQLGLYEKAMPITLTWEEKLSVAKESGFDYVEISIDETQAKLMRLEEDDLTIDEIKKASHKVGIPILTMCLSALRKYPLGSHDPLIQAKGIEIVEKACAFAVKCGIRVIQFPGYDVYYETQDESTVSNFSTNLKICVQIAAKYGVILAFETMETLFMDTVKKALEYVVQNDSPYLQIYPDLGNVTNASRISKISVGDDIEAGHGHIVAAHMKEVIEGVYREIPYGTGDTHFKEAIRELKKQGVALYTGEFWYVGNPNWKEDLLFANDYLRKLIEA